MIKRWVLLLLLIPCFCFAGPIQKGHRAVIAALNVASGGAGSLYLNPNANGSSFSWTAQSGGDDDYLEVDEGKDSPDDATYVYTTSAYSYETFHLDDDGGVLSGKTITNVTIYVRVECTTSNVVQVVAKPTTSYRTSANKNTTTSYTWVSESWGVNPDTSSAWTQGDINGLQAGVTTRALSGTTTVSTVYVKVDYE